MQGNRSKELLDKAILSLSEWKDLVVLYPRLIRSAPEYVRDALEHYGLTHESKFGRRFTWLKALQLSGKADERLIGHGQVQTRILEILATLCRDNSKMILLVGPNGSAKSTIWNAAAFALEAYSKEPEGARYVIEWIFPHDDDNGKRVGFVRALDPLQGEEDTFAFMDEEKLDKVICDSGCNPAWLYEPNARQKYFQSSSAKYVSNNDVCPKCYKILQELITIYKTKKKMLTEYDPDEVLKLAERHIRIRKTSISKIYQEGISVVDPGDNPLHSSQKPRYPYGLGKKKTPYLLKNLELPELSGPLSKAANGLLIMEDSLEGILQFVSQFFNDKRKLNIESERFTLDIMLVGSINPEKFALLKENPEYNRFRTRLEIINVPYLLNYAEEVEVYKNKIDDLRPFYHIAPHTEELFALFCVMSRLQPIMESRDYRGYEEHPDILRIKDKLRQLTPLDKAKIYRLEKLPERLSRDIRFTQEEQNTINRYIDLIYNEYSEIEGRSFGFSYREVDAIIDRAIMQAPHGFLSPITLIKKLHDLIHHEKEDYPFLKNTDIDFDRLLKLLDEEYFRIINVEMRDVFRFDYEEQIIREIGTYLVQGLRVIYVDRGTIKNQAGDNVTDMFLRDREMMLFGKRQSEEEREKFWYNWSAKVNTDLSTEQNIRQIFEVQIQQTRDRMYQEKKNDIRKKIDAMLLSLNGGALAHLTPREQEEIRTNIETLLAKGYSEDSAKELLGYLHSNLERLVLKS